MSSQTEDKLKPSLNDLTQSGSNESNRYNISNLLKHIYALKYNNKTVNSNNNSNAPSTSSSQASLNNESGSNQNDSSKQFWMPDEQVKECFQCNEKFTTFRRRHVSFFLFICILVNVYLFIY